jgi:hypothetical protein
MSERSERISERGERIRWLSAVEPQAGSERSRLAEAGVEVRDTADGSVWQLR